MYPSLSIRRTVCSPHPILISPCTFCTSYPTHHATHHYPIPPPPQWISLILPIRNSIIHPPSARSPPQWYFSDPLPITAKDKCMLLAFVMYLLRHHLFCSSNNDLCYYPPKYRNQTDGYSGTNLIRLGDRPQGHTARTGLDEY